MIQQLPGAALAPYRVLDLTEGGVNLAGRLLGDLGADVIRIEPPGGSPTRGHAPFIPGTAGSEVSAYWLAFNCNKRGITLDPSSTRGGMVLAELARTADIILFSSSSDQMGDADSLEVVRRSAPKAVCVTISPFGLAGPYATYRGTDLTLWALSGFMYLTGDPDRPPVRISVPILEAMAGAYAASAAMTGLWRMQQQGRGQEISVNMREVGIWAAMGNTGHGRMFGRTLHREGQFRQVGYTRLRATFPCRDGFIVHFTMEGPWGAPFNRRLAAWIIEETGGPPYLRDFDWEHWSPASKLRRGEIEAAAEDVRRVEEPFAQFFERKTKAELFERALSDELLIAPVFDAGDLLSWQHFQDTGFWTPMPGNTEGSSLGYPGPASLLSLTPASLRCPAPTIGQHNTAVYEGELRYSHRAVRELEELGVI